MGDKSYLKSFSREEYLTHVGKLQRRMEEEGLDLLLLSSPENIYYATGYRSWYTSSLFRPVFVFCNLRRTAATGAFASGHPAEPNGHLH